MEKVILETFEGPLDLLLHLIKDHKIDIYDIPIFTITQQYLEYLRKMHEYNIEVASEFLVLASTLIAIKVKMLLPREGEAESSEAEDPRMELVQQLLEYERFKEVSQTLGYLIEFQGKSFYRPRDEELYGRLGREFNALEQTTPLELKELMTYVLERVVERRLPPYQVKIKQISLGDKIDHLLSLLHKSPALYFGDIVDHGNRSDVVVSFLALLDLYKQGKVNLYQSENFTSLKITVRKDESHAV